MKTKPHNRTLFTTICILIISLSSYNSLAQKDVMELTFTAINNSYHIQLDSIKVMNRTQGSDTILYWPDTVLSLYYVGINEIIKSKDAFQVFQNYPNPMADLTTVSLFVPEKDQVGLQVTDPTGRVILKSDRILDKGIHSFRLTPGGGNLYFFTAQWRGMSRSIKILHANANINGLSSLKYIGSEVSAQQLKATLTIQNFVYNIGDELLYIGYANALQSGMIDVLEESTTYTFQFATNIPCPGTTTVEYEGQVYNTIQIFSQCWLKENLNVGTMIPGNQEMTDNSIIEKYCFNNEPDSCTKYGGLYQWWEMMQYINQQGTQGICPTGWHLPTDEEWKVLEGTVDSQYGIGDPEWETYYDCRGYDVGTKLKTTSGWKLEGNGTDFFDYSGLASGIRKVEGTFFDVGYKSIFWTSTEDDYYKKMTHYLLCDCPGVLRYSNNFAFGFSVRCIKDY